MVTTMSPTSPAPTAPAQAAKDRLIVALDFPDAAAALRCVDQFAGSVSWFKVGLELFLASGDSVVRELKQRGYSIFLDLKLHDIPNTVSSAIRSLARLEPDLLTVHAAGGRTMLNAAAEAARSLPRPPQHGCGGSRGDRCPRRACRTSPAARTPRSGVRHRRNGLLSGGSRGVA